MGNTCYTNFLPFTIDDFERHLYVYYFNGIKQYPRIEKNFKFSSDGPVQGNNFLHIILAVMPRGDTRSLSADLRERIHGIEAQHTSCTQIGNCTPYWSTSDMCSIFHGCLVVPFIFMRKLLVSKVEIWIRWEYPTRTRGTDFRRMLSATKDILTPFYWRLKAPQRNKHQSEFHLFIIVYFIYFWHFEINLIMFTSIRSTWVQNLRTFPTTTRIVLKWTRTVKLMVGEYQGKYFKTSFTIRNKQTEYVTYSYLIYSAHICHH